MTREEFVRVGTAAGMDPDKLAKLAPAEAACDAFVAAMNALPEEVQCSAIGASVTMLVQTFAVQLPPEYATFLATRVMTVLVTALAARGLMPDGGFVVAAGPEGECDCPECRAGRAVH